MKKKNSKAGVVILIIMLIVGGGLLLYPSVADYWNSTHAARVLESYQAIIDSMDEEDFSKYWNDAVDYNNQLNSNSSVFLTEEMEGRYDNLLNLNGDGLIGKIEIPNINVSLPIYHGCSEKTLQSYIGHIEWTSLPVGGNSTHCALSGHRGLPSAKLFSNLDALQPGDVFVLYILDRQLTYEVVSIYTVEPDDTSYLKIVEGEDLCTLVTCTPYGINTHRLLVRGRRIENLKEAKVLRISSDALMIEPVIVAPVLAIPLLIILAIWLTVTGRKKRKKMR